MEITAGTMRLQSSNVTLDVWFAVRRLYSVAAVLGRSEFKEVTVRDMKRAQCQYRCQ